MPGKGRKVHGQIILYCGVAALVCLLDQVSKFYSEKFIDLGKSVPLIKDTIHLTLVHNTGAAFGIFKGHPHMFSAVAVLSAVLIVYFFTKKNQIFLVEEKTALALILGGAIGNLIDRIRLGYVVDFIDLRVWPVFNIADSFITIGAVVLGVSIIFRSKGKEV